MSLKQGIAFEETAHKLVLLCWCCCAGAAELRCCCRAAGTNQSIKICALQLDVWVQVDFTVIA